MFLQTAIISLPVSLVFTAESELNHTVEIPTLLDRGKQLYDAGRFAEAAEVWQQAVDGDILQQALSLTYLSRAYQALGEWDSAWAAIEQSLNLIQNQPLLHGERVAFLARALNTRGRLHLLMGNAEAALKDWQQAEASYRQVHDEWGSLGSQIDQAQALQVLGLYRRSITLLEEVEQSLGLLRLDGNPQNRTASQVQSDLQLQVTGLVSLGIALQATGNLQKAQTVLTESLAMAEQLGDRAAIATTWLQLGNTARTLDSEAAFNYYDFAVNIAPHPLTQLQARLNQLRLLVNGEQWTEVQTLLRAIQSNLSQIPPSRSAVYARVNLAESLFKIQNSNFNLQNIHQNTQLSLPDDRHIAEILGTAIQQARELGDGRSQSYAMGMLGQLYERNGQWSEAKDLTQKALSLAQRSNASEIVYLWEWQLGRILCRGERPCATAHRPGAIAAYTEAVNTLDTLRKDLVTNPEIQAQFQEQIEPVYRQLIDLLLPPSNPSSLGEQPSQEQLKQARETFEALQLAELDNFFRQACLDAQPQQIDRIDPSAAVFHTILLPERLVVILSLPGQPLRYYQTELPQGEIESVLGQVRQSLNRAFPTQLRLPLARQVYDWLIRPVEAELAQQDIKTLVFVLDGKMRNLPMATLYDGDRYLVEQYAVANTPGLQLLNPRPISSEQLELLSGGLTEARQGFSALPSVGTELERIAQIVPTEIFLNQAFTELNLQNQIHRLPAPVVHLATHGKFGSTLEDTFILTWDDRVNAKELEALLTAREPSLSGAIELLILSACQTASGDGRSALGLAGIAVRSGARSTIASLWRVQDQSTANLMVAFYQALSQPGVSKAEALRQAQLQLLQDPQYEHPFFWGSFVLVGNWL